jgi:hypothetical protein
MMETTSTIEVSKTRRRSAFATTSTSVREAMIDGKGLDERTSLFKALREKEQELVSALAGDPSPQQQAIIGDSVKNMLYIASLDNYLMQT